jgi:ADP-ribosylation factor GTPase-activating protein 2/3
MKVGGNESAKQFMSKHGNAAAFASKDPNVKYTSPGAVAYKAELKRRAAKDEANHPETVTADDIGQKDPQDKRKSVDFFESFDKPNVHKPTPPPSRTATPGRTPSPADGVKPVVTATSTPRATLSVEHSVPRTTTSSALRSTRAAGTTGARRTGGVLGAKKPAKLAVKKISETISFEEAEKMAKEEAERIEKWGADETELKQPEPIKPVVRVVSASLTSTSTPVSKTEVKSVTQGVQRLGFGMVANAPKQSVGITRAAPCTLLGYLTNSSRTRGNLRAFQLREPKRNFLRSILR